MAPPQKNETAVDALKKMLADLAQASILPDADQQFFSQLQQMMQEWLRAHHSDAQQGQPQQQGQPLGGPLPGAAGMPPGGGGPPGMPNTGGAMPGLSPVGQPGGPSTDELMRVLSQAQPVGAGR